MGKSCLVKIHQPFTKFKKKVSPTNFLSRLRCRSQGSAPNRCQKSKSTKTRFLTFRDCWLTETDIKMYTTKFSHLPVVVQSR